MTIAPDVPKSHDITVEPLFVDLDGTLIAGDLTWESLFLALRQSPWLVFVIPFWFLRGRGYLKRRVAQRVTLKVDVLPYRPQVIEFLRQRRSLGGEVILATASDRRVAQAVAEQVGVFTDFFGTDGGKNLKGAAKLAHIEDYCRERGFAEFSYMGDTWADVPIWKRCQHVYSVAPPAALVAALKRAGTATPEILVPRPPLAWPAFQALRPQHWVKNLLLAVPLVLAHKVFDGQRLGFLLLAIVAFSACASAVYLINDLMDLDLDRRHAAKQRRPLAAGTLPVPYAPPLVVGLLVVAFGISLGLLPLAFTGLLLAYFVANYCYSTWLKRKPMVDVLTLAGMYTLRVLAGGIATDVPVSEWLLAFSTFFFVSLAFAKRYSELIRSADMQESGPTGRGYLVSDITLIESMGPCSGYLAVLVLALYMNSPQVEHLYANRAPLWLICMLLLYWISRIWFWAKRGALGDDPVVFAITDRVSLSIGLLSCVLIVLASWGS